MSPTSTRERGERKRLGLALGAGAARGLAHVGVLFGLAEAGIAVDAIAGTSMGALIGALYATGQLEVFERDLRDRELSDLWRYLDPVWPREGLLSGERATQYLRSLIGDWRIEDLPIPYAAVAVDLVSGEEVWIRSGKLLDAVRASISLPGIFVPVEETVESFEALANGELDEIPEQAFFNVGGVESVLAKSKQLQES